jgi:transcription elongation GreA/GreB family factor
VGCHGVRREDKLSTQQFNFQNSLKLIEELKKHRATVALNDEVLLKNREISTKTEGIKVLLERKKPLEEEVSKIRSYFERGIYDRFAYRSAIDAVQPELHELMRRITGLEQDIQRATWLVGHYLKLINPAQEFLDAFNHNVYLYSQVTINQNGETSSYLIVPDLVRLRKFDPALNMLAWESELGKALINQPVGMLKTDDRRFQNLNIESTRAASNLVLQKVYVDESDIDGHRHGKVKDRTYGGSDQRWQDGARDDYYIACRKCSGLYPVGSSCDC